MTVNSYTREIVVSNSPNAAYRALTLEFDKWWTPGSNSIRSVDDTVTFRFDSTYWIMRAKILVPNEYVELECVEAHHVHEGLPPSILKEWEGSKLKWNIEKRGEKISIAFVHEGLVPTLGCYDICEAGWDHFFVESLKDYLDKGKGDPA